MKVALAPLLAIALALAAAPARGATAGADAPAGARLVACRHAPAIEQRTAVVGTWMKPIADGRRLALKIDLWQRTPGTRWTPRADVPGLGVWTSPSDAQLGTRAGDVFKYRQAVGRLVVPAAYRFHVTFRWLGADGAVVREASVTTRVCRQPDLRPDLVLLAPVQVLGSPRPDGRVRYAVLVGNEGKSAVAHAVVAATFPGESVPGLHLRSVGRLAPGATAVVRFVGPGCVAGGTPATFVVDPANAVDETNEANNELAASCPAP